jgi:predicted DsbA family dithiol-disulfide isomerase
LKLVAERVAASAASFNLDRFNADMQNGNGLEAFRKDIQEVKYRSIQRFPALLIRRANQQPILITGYKPADALIDIIGRY